MLKWIKEVKPLPLYDTVPVYVRLTDNNGGFEKIPTIYYQMWRHLYKLVQTNFRKLSIGKIELIIRC